MNQNTILILLLLILVVYLAARGKLTNVINAIKG